MSLDEEMLQLLMASFREELAEGLARVNAGLATLEQNPRSGERAAIVQELFRNMHSLKGAARAVHLKPIEELALGMEDVFGAAKRGSIQITAELFALLYRGLELISLAMAGFEAGRGIDPTLDLPGYLVNLAEAWRRQPVQPPQIETTKAPESPARSEPVPVPVEPAARGEETIRVPAARLDELLAYTGELLVARLRADLQVEEVQEMNALLIRRLREWQHVRGMVNAFFQQSGSGVATQVQTFLQRNEQHLLTLSARLSGHLRRVSEDTNRLALITDELQEGVKRARMLPLSTLLNPFRSMVQDRAREKGVEVVLEAPGSDTEMDKQILEQLRDPLMHILRNCVEHGIEPPDERLERGKPPWGTISLGAERQGAVIVVRVADDGAGIDTTAVRDAAVRRGLLREETIAEMDDEQIASLVFSAGLSTSPMISEASGRGVGLDVVRRSVESLQGRIEVHSVPEQGTTFILTVPLTLASTHCLLVRAAGQTYALPLSAVEQIVLVGQEDVASVEDREMICHHDRPLSLVHLADALRLPKRSPPFSNGRSLPAIILIAERQRIAFLVDDLVGEQEVMVKTLGKQLARVPNVAGATIVGTGGVILILNVNDLIKSAHRSTGHSLPPVGEHRGTKEERRTILVVDDSITTRTLERNILTTAGYVVHLATDGEEAMAALIDNGCDLVVSDIDMPRMDGFQLTQWIKQDERYGDLPVILVSSLDSPEHKARGIEVGADAYIVKGTFDQEVLLETIQQLI